MIEAMSIKTLAFLNLVVAWLAWLFAYSGVPQELAAILFVLMLADIVFGVWKSIAVNGNSFNSSRLNSGILGKAAGLFVVFMLALTAKAVSLAIGASFDLEHLISAILITIIIGETYSLVRNFVCITQRIELPEWSAWVFLARSLVTLAESLFRRYK